MGTDPLRCPVLAGFDPGDAPSARRALTAVAPLPLVQAWRESPEEGFRPGTVRVGTQGGALWIFAELADDDIFNPVTAFNDPAFLRGDAFEMFFAPEGQSSYRELHVTPGNVRLQLCFPRLGAARELPCDVDDPLEPFKVAEVLFESWTTVERGRWTVLACVPLASIVETKGDREGDSPLSEGGAVPVPVVIRCSFCRYDWTRGSDCPVLSSTSLHPVCDFHRVGEWRRIDITPTPPL